MKATGTTRIALTFLTALFAAIILAGCHEMKVETTLNADGSGVREMALTIEMDEGDEEEIVTLSDYRELMNVTDERGWSYDKTTATPKDSEKAKEYHRFNRVRRAGNIAELAQMSGDIHIVGTNTNSKFDDVYFTNSIYVEKGVSPHGRTLTYRETYSWSGLTESLLDYRLDGYRPVLVQQYPTLEPAELNEWFGFLKGTFMAAVDEGIFDMASEERARHFTNSIKRVVAYAMDMIRAKDPDADDSHIMRVVLSIFVEWDELDKTAEDMGLMGVVLAIVLDLTMRVDIPGRIVETNADRRETHSDPSKGRQTLVWDIDPGAAVTRPIEIYVKSEIPNP
jgi:hypothetical protein